MPYTEHTSAQTHPSGDAQDGTDKPKDRVLKDKAAEVEQAVDGISIRLAQVVTAFGEDPRLTTGRRISGGRQATTSTTSNPDHGMIPRPTIDRL